MGIDLFHYDSDKKLSAISRAIMDMAGYVILQSYLPESSARHDVFLFCFCILRHFA